MTVAHSIPGYRKSGFIAFLVTSFWGAFNDNFFRFLVTCFALEVLPHEKLKIYIPLTLAVFNLPYLICSGFTGYLADRFTKKHIIIWAKWIELIVMAAGLIAFQFRAINILLFVLFLMGAQSALYNPAKYGFLPETLPENDLPNGNGLTQLCTFIAIIAGSWTCGQISKFFSQVWIAGPVICILISAIGIVTAHFVSKTHPGKTDTSIRINPISAHIATLKNQKGNKILLLSICGNSFFWFMAALFQNNLSLLVEQEMGSGSASLGHLLGATGLGIGLGCLVCGAISQGRVEYGLVIPGGIFTAITAILIGLTGKHLIFAVIFSAMLGFTAGIYQLPLSASIQKNSPEAKRGACLALSSAMDCVAMLIASLVHAILLNLFHISVCGVFHVLGIIVFAWLLLLVYLHPDFAKRTMFLFSKNSNQ